MARWVRRVGGAVAVLLLIRFVASVWMERLAFPYEGPEGAVAAGDEIMIRDPGVTCGPILVSIWRPSVLGQWTQIEPDHHTWWQVWDSSGYATNVPCSSSRSRRSTAPFVSATCWSATASAHGTPGAAREPRFVGDVTAP